MQSHLLSFKSIINSLINKLNDLYYSYTNNIVNESVWDFYYKMQLSLWFTDNWPNIKLYAHSLSTSKTINLKKIADMPITAYKADNTDIKNKKSKALKTLLECLEQALLELNLNDIKNLFNSSLTKLVSYIEQNSPMIKNVNNTVIKHNDNIKNKQFNQLEVVLQQIINNLPKQYQHEARQIIINNSNNKLSVLQNFINSKKIL